jgi:hypothetical protein
MRGLVGDGQRGEKSEISEGTALSVSLFSHDSRRFNKRESYEAFIGNRQSSLSGNRIAGYQTNGNRTPGVDSS